MSKILGTTVRSKLTVGDFVLFRKNDDDVEPIWLGRIMSNPDWQGQGVYQNHSRQRSSFHGVAIGQGEVGLYMMWYERNIYYVREARVLGV